MRDAVARTIADRRIGSVYGALACGADIVFAEVALAAGAALNVVLPFPADAFFETSVRIGDPPDAPTRWDERFRTCLAAAASLTLLVERSPAGELRDFLYFYAFRLAAGLALIGADRATADCIMLTFADGRGVTNIAGAPKAASDWAAAGRTLVALPIDLSLRSRIGRKAGNDPFRAVVFPGPAGLAELVRKIGTGGTGGNYQAIGRALVLDDMRATAEILDILARQQDQSGIVADFGPVVGPEGVVDETRIAELPGARLQRRLASAGPRATLQFAAEARFLNLDRLLFAAVPDSPDSGHPGAVPQAYDLSFAGS